MITARSNYSAGEPRRRIAAGGLTHGPSATAQAVAPSQDQQARAGRRSFREERRPYVYVAAGLSFVAAQIHGWVMLDHFAEQPAAEAFFLMVAFAQGAYAAALLDRPRSALLLAAGLGATVGLMLLLVAEHTVGLPMVGLDEHAHDHAGAFDPAALAAFVAEAGLVLTLAMLLRGRSATKGAR